MNKIIVLIVCFSIFLNSSDLTNEYGIDVFGKSFHSHSGYNELNPGLGAYFSQTEKTDYGSLRFGWGVNAGYYVDSYNHRAKYVIPGIVFKYGDKEGWNSSFNIGLGYYEGSGNKGVGPGSALSAGYNRVLLCSSFSPKNGKDGAASVSFWLRVRVGEF